MSCKHEEFNANVAVHRIQKSDLEPDEIVAYQADIKVECRQCGQPFEFFGLPMGMSFYQPTISIDGQVMRVPLIIPGTKPPDRLPGFGPPQYINPMQEFLKQ
jgi:hypothetical protein